MTNRVQPCLNYKVSGPNLVAPLKHTPTFEWCMVRLRSKNGHQEHASLKQIGLFVWISTTILGSMFHAIIEGHVCSFYTKDSFWQWIRHSHESSKLWGKMTIHKIVNKLYVTFYTCNALVVNLHMNFNIPWTLCIYIIMQNNTLALYLSIYSHN